MSGRSVLAAVIAAAPGLALAPQSAYAETTAHGAQVEDIIVTSQRRSENLQDVPIAVSAVTADQLKGAGIVDTVGLASAVSGVAIHETGQSFQPHIHGVGTLAFGAGVENPVALYVDDVYIGNQLQGRTELGDISQVTITKGPQGTLFGRNATGGVIQLMTRNPEDAFGGEIKTELDNYLTSRSNLYLTGPVSEALKGNLSVNYTTQGEGWGENLTTGKDIDKINHDISVRSKWIYTLGTKTDIKLALDYGDKKSSLGSNQDAVIGTTPFFPSGPKTSNPWDVSLPFGSSIEQNGGGASLHIDHDLGFARLVSISAYRTVDAEAMLDSSLNPIPLLDIHYALGGNQWTQELQLVSPESDTFKWVTGLYYYYSEDEVKFSDVTLHGVYAGFAVPFANEVIARTHARQTTYSGAAFAQATAQIAPNTNLTVGLRYTDEIRRLGGSEEGSVNGSPFFPTDLATGFPAADPAASRVSDKLSVHKLTYRVALDHNLTEDSLIYASYNRGFKSGGFNTFRVDVGSYNPEVIDAFEVGLKSEFFDHQVRVNGSGFFNKYKDIQVQKYIGPSAVVVNGAKAEFYGIDIDGEWLITEKFSLRGGASWLHAKFTDYPDADFFFDIPGGGIFSAPGSAKGKRVPYAPEFTANLSLNYTTPLSSGVLDLNLTDAFSSAYFGEPSNSYLLRQNSHNLLSAGAKWTSADEAWTLGVWGRNLLDRPVASLMFAVVPLGYGVDYANPPRSVGVSATYRFGAR